MQYFTESYIVSGKADSPGASPTSVLDNSGMAGWTLESMSSGSQHSSPLRSSTSSQSNEAQPNPHDTRNLSKQENAVSQNPSSSNTLVETLKTCLTTLPHHHSNTAAMSSVSHHRVMNESSSRKKTSNNSSLLPASHNSASAASKVSTSGASSSKPLGVVGTKATKRRPRASRRVPTTVLEASCNEFRDMVQKLTGIPAGHHAPKGEHHGGAVRPQPIRPGMMANGSLVVDNRPEVPMSSPYGSNANHSSPSPAIGFLQELQRKSSSSFPFISMKTEGGGDQLAFNQRLTDLTNAAPPDFSATAPSSWGSGYYNNMRAAAAAGQLDQTSISNFQEDSLSLSQIDSWFHNDLQPSEMRV